MRSAGEVIMDLVGSGLSDAQTALVLELAALATMAQTPARGSKSERNARYYQAHRLNKATEKAENVLIQPSENRLKATENVLIQTPPRAPVRDNLLEIITLETTATVTERASDWPRGDARDHAAALVEMVATVRLDPARAPDLAITMGRLHAWKTAGASWDFDVVPVVTKLAASARRPITSWKYFDGAIAESVAANRQALEIPQAQNVTPIRPGTGPPVSITDRIGMEKAEAKRRVLEGT